MITTYQGYLPAIVILSALVCTPATAQPAPAPSPAASASATPAASTDPCTSLSNLVSRPSFTTSACVVKPGDLLVETGYTNLTTSGSGASSLVNYPQTNMRVGLANNLEFDFIPPSIERVSGSAPANGVSDGSIGAKFELAHDAKFATSVNVAYTLQSGTAPFTGSGDGILANLNASYAVTPIFSLFATAGYNEQSEGTPQTPARYHDFQPSLGGSLSLPQSFAVYVEGFNQSSTGPGVAGSFGVDTGIQKDVGSRLQLDVNYYDYLTIRNGTHQHSIGAGAAYLIGP